MKNVYCQNCKHYRRNGFFDNDARCGNGTIVKTINPVTGPSIREEPSSVYCYAKNRHYDCQDFRSVSFLTILIRMAHHMVTGW